MLGNGRSKGSMMQRLKAKRRYGQYIPYYMAEYTMIGPLFGDQFNLVKRERSEASLQFNLVKIERSEASLQFNLVERERSEALLLFTLAKIERSEASLQFYLVKIK